MNKKTIKENITGVLHDARICIFAGIAISVGISLLVAVISGIASGFELYSMLNAVRSSLLIVGALMMFVVAGVILGQKSNQKIRQKEKWKTTFYILGPTFVFLIMSVTILGIASIADYIVWIS